MLQTPLIQKEKKRFNVNRNRGPFTATAKAEQAGEAGWFFILTASGIAKVRGVTVYSCLPGVTLFCYNETAFISHVCETSTGRSLGSGANLDEATADMYANIEKYTDLIFKQIKKHKIFAL